MTTPETDGIPVSAIIQPIVNQADGDSVPSPLGRVNEERFLYLGRSPLVAGRDWIVWGERNLDVSIARPIYVGDEISHWWGVLTPREKVEQ